jgi:hypothetical protein
MSKSVIIHKAVGVFQIASLKTVIANRSEILPLFEPLDQACGAAVCGPAMAILYYGSV